MDPRRSQFNLCHLWLKLLYCLGQRVRLAVRNYTSLIHPPKVFLLKEPDTQN